ncbi:hypothetical protein POSPLADRAFT_1045056 [Postia placenta MAD-698-R-SB12]|uniref:Uncharacterized protein n=1 Tax=Postia placenta MAD-698-R-SB12 TaxID=670580 RepID=A0A1X6N5K4_9APHY|nr:hypothetical protein POSPLADRAFT_1045056 [Postia placenta MAD-698-R-SB12]OSX63887.1 hypothetical protein POSPLADRAFT_1045056 [Postia placenta MAD-698-R-SB12]
MAAAFLPQMLWGWAGASSHMTEDPGDQIEAADTAAPRRHPWCLHFASVDSSENSPGPSALQLSPASRAARFCRVPVLFSQPFNRGRSRSQTDSASAIRIRTRIRRVDQRERRPYAVLLHTVGPDTIIARRHGFTITQGVRTSRCARRAPARAGAGVRDLAAGMETVADPRLLEWYGRRTCGPAAPRQLLRSARTPTSRRDTQKSHRALCTGPYTSGRTSRLSSTNKHAHTGLGLTVHSCGREDRPDASWLSRACCDRPSALGAGVSASNCVKTFAKVNGAPGLRRALDHSTCKWSAALAADDARLLPSVTVRPDWRQRLWAAPALGVFEFVVSYYGRRQDLRCLLGAPGQRRGQPPPMRARRLARDVAVAPVKLAVWQEEQIPPQITTANTLEPQRMDSDTHFWMGGFCSQLRLLFFSAYRDIILHECNTPPRPLILLFMCGTTPADAISSGPPCCTNLGQSAVSAAPSADDLPANLLYVFVNSRHYRGSAFPPSCICTPPDWRSCSVGLSVPPAPITSVAPV